MTVRWGLIGCLLCIACSKTHGPKLDIDGGGGDAGGQTRDGSLNDGSVHDAMQRDADRAPFDAGGVPDANLALPDCLWDRPSAQCERSPYFSLDVRLNAARFGSDARFVAADDIFVLVARDSDVDLVVKATFSWSGEETLVEQWELPAGWRAIDVIDAQGVAFVLGCDDSDCRLISVDPYASTLGDEPRSTFSKTMEPRGLAFWPHVVERDGSAALFPCVYGRGLQCFDGTQWRTELADEPLVAATLRAPQAVLTVDGRVLWRAGNTGSWTAVNDLSVTTPRWIDNAGFDRVGLQVDPWTWAWIDSTGQVSRCDLGEAFSAVRSVSPVTTFGVARSGEAFTYSDWGLDGQSCMQLDTAETPIVELTTAPCGIINNVRQLTPTTFSGTRFCAID